MSSYWLGKNPKAKLTDSQITLLHPTVDVAISAGASNVVTCTVTVKDSSGNTLAGVHKMDMIVTDSATNLTLTGTSASGSLAATTGTVLKAHTAKKHVTFITANTGIAEFTLTDTGKTEGELFAVFHGGGPGYSISSPTVTASYG
tara:strand:+ start:340 stop:774 length:435 start_codon:yes stop_codon:yes gene_type:complete